MKLAYQFGHELGQVLANSWQQDAKPAPPCQWLEEGLVEAVSLHGLRRFAKDWKENPPSAGDNAFGDSIGKYSEDIIRAMASRRPAGAYPRRLRCGSPITATRSKYLASILSLRQYPLSCSPNTTARPSISRRAGRAQPAAWPQRGSKSLNISADGVAASAGSDLQELLHASQLRR
ncbi:hypothetical protein RFM99_19690 [Mesorhizobium sp. VK4C]|uniref:hypothetical protein n=1 Tax=Mesorhizobium captivum TaxID=3072319 RepID=UPI002A241F22|nr:hypothetical protein [Mesorhizobium sp. VK4C]MDX8500633.1 hypothetical protein [Mesorhizobium sp. VK4C]